MTVRFVSYRELSVWCVEVCVDCDRDLDEETMEEEIEALVVGQSPDAELFTLEIGVKDLRRVLMTEDEDKNRIEDDARARTGKVYATYVIFGMRVRSEPFHLFPDKDDDAAVNFGPMRDGFLLKTTFEDLRKFLASSAPIYVEIFPHTSFDQKDAEATNEDRISVAAGVVPIGYALSFNMSEYARAREKKRRHDDNSESDERTAFHGEIRVDMTKKLYEEVSTPIAEIDISAAIRYGGPSMKPVTTLKHALVSVAATPSERHDDDVRDAPRLFSETNAADIASKALERVARAVATEDDEDIRSPVRREPRSSPPLETSSPKRVKTVTLPPPKDLIDRLVREKLAGAKKELRRAAEKRERAFLERDKEREHSLNAMSAKYAKLEEELRHALREVEKRERAIAADRTRARAMFERKMNDIKAKERQLNDLDEQRKEMERERMQEFVRRQKSVEAQRAAAEKRLAELEIEYAEYRKEQRRTPEAELKAIAIEAQNEVKHLMAQLEEERKGHAECRRQVTQLAAELRRRNRADALRRHEEQRKLRIQYAAREQQLALTSDKRRLAEIRQDLNRLRASTTSDRSNFYASSSTRRPYASSWRDADAKGGRSTDRTQGQPTDTMVARNDENHVQDMSSSRSHEKKTRDEVSRLRSQRSQLLQTVGYGKDHPLIKQLDAAIMNAEKARGK